MKLENEKLEQPKEKQPYETPQLTKHGSVEQVTGQLQLSGCDSVDGVCQ